jgi:hypothetical protein
VACSYKNSTFKFVFIQEDKSSRNARIQRMQVSIQPVLFAASINVVVLCFVCFQVPLISCASTWRVGETKKDALPKFSIVALYIM